MDEQKNNQQEQQEEARPGRRATAQIEAIKSDMEKVTRTVNLLIKITVFVVCVCLILGGIYFLFKQWIIVCVFCTPAVIVSLLFLGGLMVVRPEERFLIEFLGQAYCVKKPGLRWVSPILMRKRMVAYTWKQPVDLFPERRYPNGVHIDLKKGGKTQLVEPILWVRMDHVGQDLEGESVLRMAYSVDNWKEAVTEGGEDALRTCLNNLMVEEVLSATHDSSRASWWEAVRENFPALEEVIKSYGLVPVSLTISDFNWDPAVVASRQKVFEEERSIAVAELSKKAAKDEVAQQAMELGGKYAEMVRILAQKRYGGDMGKAEKAAMELMRLDKAAQSGGLIQALSDGDGLSSSVISFITSIAKSIQGKEKTTNSEE
ncbi:hypothetical protein KKC65_02655 [Patescibacteria group bacterium]|nr:hypothetical protein [Patescibacteria group bacterium]